MSTTERIGYKGDLDWVTAEFADSTGWNEPTGPEPIRCLACGHVNEDVEPTPRRQGHGWVILSYDTNCGGCGTRLHVEYEFEGDTP